MGTSKSRSGNNAPRGGNWSNAKRNSTSFTRGTGASPESLVSDFVSAIGGKASLSKGGGAGGSGGRLASAVKSGQSLGTFLGGIASNGLDQTLRSIGLENLVGADPHNVLSGIADYICGNGGPLGDAISRSAVVEVLAEIFDESNDTYSELRDNWNSQIDKDRVIDLMSLFLAQAIFQRILSDLGDIFESNSISATDAENKEKEVLSYIKEMVTFELGEIDPLNFDWQGRDGEELIKRNLAAALDQLRE